MKTLTGIWVSLTMGENKSWRSLSSMFVAHSARSWSWFACIKPCRCSASPILSGGFSCSPFSRSGDSEPNTLAEMFRETALVDVRTAADGLEFDAAPVAAEAIRKDAGYPGVRVRLTATLGRTQIPVQCDIGFGDAMTPEPTTQSFPTLLDHPAPVLRVYSLETVIAEKLEAMVKLAGFNTRLKDYFDLWVLMRYERLDHAMLPVAIRATFRRRGTALPDILPTGLTDSFSQEKQALWNAFLARSRLSAPPLSTVVTELRERCWPLLRA